MGVPGLSVCVCLCVYVYKRDPCVCVFIAEEKHPVEDEHLDRTMDGVSK